MNSCRFWYVIELFTVCDENLHFNEMKQEFNEHSSFTYFIYVSVYQDCTRTLRTALVCLSVCLYTNFTDSPRIIPKHWG
jgi:hypothetical protein